MEHRKFANHAAQEAWAVAEKAAAFLGEDANIVKELIALAEQRAARVALTVLANGTRAPLTSPQAACALACRIADKVKDKDVEIYDGCAEPGYDDKLMVLANWNDANARWAAAIEKLERLGVPLTLEWSDEWIMCDDCYKGVRCSPDSYDWTPYYWFSSEVGAVVCGDCVKADPADYISWLVNAPKRANTLLDASELENAGYVRLNVEYENGFHHGMDADPARVLNTLRTAGISEVIFDILGGASQFYVTFWVWVPAAEVDAAQAVLDRAAHDAINGPSISGALSAALRQAAHS